MTTLYKPVLIESVEQAEALPAGTLAVNWEIPSAAVRVGPEVADGYPWLVNSQSLGWHRNVVGSTALIPVDVEVEQIRESGGRRRAKTLYVTPWSTPSNVERDVEGEALADCGDEA